MSNGVQSQDWDLKHHPNLLGIHGFQAQFLALWMCFILSSL